MSMTFIAAGDTECVDDGSIGDLYDKRSQWRRCLSPSFSHLLDKSRTKASKDASYKKTL